MPVVNADMNSMKQSDIDILKNVVSQYKDRLFRFAFMRVGIREVAEDIVQEVFISFYQSIVKDQKIINYEFYLLRSISNACIDFHRKRKLSVLSLDEIEETPSEEDHDLTEEYVRIKTLIEDLSFEQAETIRLRCYDGLSFHQIAELHDTSEATVKSRYRYAIQKIRDKLNN